MIARFFHASLIVFWATSSLYAALPSKVKAIQINARSRVAVAEHEGQFRVVNARENWDPTRSAIIICDMWNKHWCAGATRRAPTWTLDALPYTGSTQISPLLKR